MLADPPVSQVGTTKKMSPICKYSQVFRIKQKKTAAPGDLLTRYDGLHFYLMLVYVSTSHGFSCQADDVPHEIHDSSDENVHCNPEPKQCSDDNVQCQNYHTT